MSRLDALEAELEEARRQRDGIEEDLHEQEQYLRFKQAEIEDIQRRIEALTERSRG